MSRQTPYFENVIAPDEFFEDQEVMKRIFNSYDERNLFMPFLYRSGRKLVSKRRQFNHWEQDPLWKVGTVETITGGATAGVAGVITLEEIDHSDSGKTSPFQIKGVIKIRTAAGEIDCYITDKNTTTDNSHTITVVPLTSTVVLGTAISAGDRIVDISNASGDGAGFIEGYKRNPIRRSGKTQIFSSKSTVYLAEIANAQKVAVKGPNGESSMHYYMQKDTDAFTDLQMRIDYQFLIGGVPNSQINDPEENTEVNFSNSLDYYTRTEGITIPFTNAPELTDFDDVQDYLNIENAPDKYMLITGDQVDRQYDTLFKGIFDNGALNHGNWGVGSDADRMVDFGFDGWRYNNREFRKMRCKAFTYKGINSDNNIWRTTSFFLPAETVTVPVGESDSLESASEMTVPRMMVRYTQSPEQNRMFSRYMRGPEQLGKDRRELIYQAECGFQFIGSRLLAKQELGV